MESVGIEFPQGQQMFTYVLIGFSMASTGFRLLLSKSADSACVIFLEHFRGYCIKKDHEMMKDMISKKMKKQTMNNQNKLRYQSYKNNISNHDIYQQKSSLKIRPKRKWHIQDTIRVCIQSIKICTCTPHQLFSLLHSFQYCFSLLNHEQWKLHVMLNNHA